MHLRRAGVGELVAMLEMRGELTPTRRHYGRLLAQLSFSESWAVFEEPDARLPIALAGIARLPNRAGEIWFGVRPGGLERFALPVVRCARAVLRSRAPDYPGGLMCLVRDGHLPGERLARFIGCVPQPVLLSGYREWTWLDGLSRTEGTGPQSAGSGAGEGARRAAGGQ